MVFSGQRENAGDYMASGPERLSLLHNFTLPHLKWGSQRHLKCIKVESTSGSGGGGDQRPRRRFALSKSRESSPAISARCGDSGERDGNWTRRMGAAPTGTVVHGGEEGINEFREKIMLDLRNVADKMKESILRKGVSDDAEGVTSGRVRSERAKEKQRENEREDSPAGPEVFRPWNLRTRRASGKAGQIGGAGINHSTSSKNKNNRGSKIEERKTNPPALRGDSLKSPTSGKRAKFSVQLTKKEIEEDLMGMLGHRPPRRPRKRPKAVQRELDLLFPGLWLTEVTTDIYKVPETTLDRKK